MLIRSCMLKKDNRTIDAIYEEVPIEMREDCVFKAEYARALLSCGDYYSGIRLVKEYLDRGVLSNQVNNTLLEGLSEGGYDEECLRFYRRLQDMAKEREFAKEPLQLFVHGNSALIRSMCHLNINAALPFMDEDMQELAKRTLAKIAPLTENEYVELAIFAADEV